MFIYFLITITLVILIAILFNYIKPNANFFLTILLSLSLASIIINPEISIIGATKGSDLFFKAIFPVLFPFLIICNLMIYTNSMKILSILLGPILCKPLGLSNNCAFPLIASYICGYPLGAKYSAYVYEQNLISQCEFEKLIFISSNASPLFLISTVGTTMLSSTKLGYLLLIPSYGTTIITALLFFKRNNQNKHINLHLKPLCENINFSLSLKKAIEDAISTILSIGGYIIIFAVIINFCKESILLQYLTDISSKFLSVNYNLINSLFLGSIELSNGCSLISTSLDISLNIKLCLIAFLAAFSGFSIISQTFSFLSKHNIKLSKYIFIKFLQGILSALLMFIILFFFT
ncbi:MAG: sporulation integral membrane protein YlbJ [Sarcina sp.]